MLQQSNQWPCSKSTQSRFGRRTRKVSRGMFSCSAARISDRPMPLFCRHDLGLRLQEQVVPAEVRNRFRGSLRHVLAGPQWRQAGYDSIGLRRHASTCSHGFFIVSAFARRQIYRRNICSQRHTARHPACSTYTRPVSTRCCLVVMPSEAQIHMSQDLHQPCVFLSLLALPLDVEAGKRICHSRLVLRRAGSTDLYRQQPNVVAAA